MRLLIIRAVEPILRVRNAGQGKAIISNVSDLKMRRDRNATRQFVTNGMLCRVLPLPSLLSSNIWRSCQNTENPLFQQNSFSIFWKKRHILKTKMRYLSKTFGWTPLTLKFAMPLVVQELQMAMYTSWKTTPMFYVVNATPRNLSTPHNIAIKVFQLYSRDFGLLV